MYVLVGTALDQQTPVGVDRFYLLRIPLDVYQWIVSTDVKHNGYRNIRNAALRI